MSDVTAARFSGKKEIEWVGATTIVITHFLAIYGLIYHFSVPNLILAFSLYIITGLGITMGYHRYFAHRGFEASPFLRKALAIMGTLSFQGPVKKWVYDHRLHHAASDEIEDPHSARHGGLFWAHFGWLFFKPNYTKKQLSSYSKLMVDFKNDKFMDTISKPIPYLIINIAFAALVFVLFGVGGLFWGVFVRMVWTWHCTWSINSIGHKFGYRNFETSDDSTNQIVIGILALGEGFHNNHHASGMRARHGLYSHEPDITYGVILLCEKLGLLKNIIKD